MRIALVAHHDNKTNEGLAAAAPPGVEVEIVRPRDALGLLGPGDAALSRIDVLPSLEGIEPGVFEIGRLEAEGFAVFNGLRAVLSMHDKLQTSRVLSAAGVPHPRTFHLVAPRAPIPLEPPVVVKPRFGSWGSEVTLCTTRSDLVDALDDLAARSWFRRQGVLVQELVPPLGHDLRIVVAGGRVVGAIRRCAAEGEWRTNVALGAERQAADPPQQALELALAAASAAEADLVGIDLMPTAEAGWTVIELNGAVEFTDEYSLGRNVFGAAVESLLDALPGLHARPLAALG
jgi:RimK family alpha-L-glutamate ligase